MSTLTPAAPPLVLPPYRPFQGFLPAYTWGVRLTLGRRRRLAIVLIFGALLGFLIGTQGIGRRRLHLPGDGAFDLWRAFDQSLLPYLIPLVALTLVAGGFQREIADRTLVYHLVRPISRRTLFLARFLAGVTVAAPVALVPMATAVATSDVNVPLVVWASLPVTATLGVLSAGAVYFLLSAWLRWGAIAGLVYTFALDNLIRNTPGSMQRLSASYYLRSVHHGLTDQAFAGLSPTVAGRLEQDADLLREAGQFEERAASGQFDPGMMPIARIPWMEVPEATLTLLGASAALLAVGLWIVSRRDYALKE